MDEPCWTCPKAAACESGYDESRCERLLEKLVEDTRKDFTDAWREYLQEWEEC